MPGLIMRKGPSPGVRFPLAESLILGRHRNADVVVQDPGASRRHAAVVQRADGFRVLDLGSTNGTLLNGKLVQGEVALRPGDLIQIGEEVFEFVLEEAPPREPPTVSLLTEALTRPGPRRAVAAGADPAGGVLPREMGKFVLTRHLGRGGMGDVYQAREREGGPELAIKVIRSEIGNRESFLDYFHNREAVLAREIDHPNVIRILEHGAVGDQHFIAMEYVAGETLQERLRRGPLPFDEALEVLRQVACGLAAAHRRGVVHSDIKPANVMIIRESAREAPAAEPAAAWEEPEVVLEFPGAARRGTAKGRYEGALREEIRKRLGEPSAPDVLIDPPYFPRASETRFLHHYWETLAASGGHLILVEGEAGAGKDRLLSEFLRGCFRMTGVGPRPREEAGGEEGRRGDMAKNIVEEARRSIAPPQPAEASPAILKQPLKEMGLSGALRAGAAAGASGNGHSPRLLELDASRVEGIPLLHAQLLPGRAAPERPGRETVAELVEAIRALPGPAALRVLGLDNASELAFELLHALLGLLPERPLLILATRDTSVLPRNARLRELLSTESARIKEIYLRPLSRYQVGRYLQDLFREPVRQDRLAVDLHRLTGGNIGRRLETLRSYFQRGVLRFDRPAGRVFYQPSPRELELTEGKQLYEKYRRYGKLEQRVLEHAAFIGPEFLFETLLRFSEMDETALFFIVRDHLRQGFFTEPSRTWYRFTNIAFQRYIAERVSPSERPRLHRKVAWLLDEAPGVSPALLRLRGHHWERAGDHPKAVRLLLEGAHLARVEYDVDGARQMYQEILRIYRSLASDDSSRRQVTDELRAWFHRDANWYEVLGGLGEEAVEVQVKITDFGISFKVKEEDFWLDRPLPLGTPRYLAPERVRRETGGPKSDIFALGIIAHEMLAGAPPFPGKKGQEVMRLNLLREVPAPQVPGVAPPPEFYDLFRGMVEKDPELRWDAERVLRTIAKIQLDQRMA